MRAICVDTGFLIGLYDRTDEFHDIASRYFVEFFDTGSNHLLIPWPILYEAISTRMVKNKEGLARLEKDWKRLAVQRRLDILSDEPFRDTVINECFDELGKPLPQYRKLSAVDRVVRRMLSDTHLRIHAFVTFNPGDFVDVCAKHRRDVFTHQARG
jgi:predicted nucleic acid-binding protein